MPQMTLNIMKTLKVVSIKEEFALYSGNDDNVVEFIKEVAMVLFQLLLMQFLKIPSFI